jgi:5-methylcytosine-specific restriction endonuclease McrA
LSKQQQSRRKPKKDVCIGEVKIMSALTNPVLWLNKSWLPHDSKTVEDSFKTVCSERGLFLDSTYVPHDLGSWINLPVEEGSDFIQLNHTRIRVPEIMLLAEYNRIPARSVVFCRRNLWRRDKGVCQYCGKHPKPDDVTMDHIHPRSKGGLSTFKNCVLCCTSCNLKKSNKSLRDSGMRLQRPKKHSDGSWSTVYYDTPKRPMWNPLYALKRKSFPKSWSAFLKNFDEALYWEVELDT